MAGALVAPPVAMSAGAPEVAVEVAVEVIAAPVTLGPGVWLTKNVLLLPCQPPSAGRPALRGTQAAPQTWSEVGTYRQARASQRPTPKAQPCLGTNLAKANTTLNRFNNYRRQERSERFVTSPCHAFRISNEEPAAVASPHSAECVGAPQRACTRDNVISALPAHATGQGDPMSKQR